MVLARKKQYEQTRVRIERKDRVPKGNLHAKKKMKLGPMLSFLVFACVFLGIFLSYVAIHANMAKIAYQNNLLKNQIYLLKNSNDRLELEIMNVSSLDKIEEVAKTHLQMIHPEQVQFISLPETPDNPNKFFMKDQEQTLQTKMNRLYRHTVNYIERELQAK